MKILFAVISLWFVGLAHAEDNPFLITLKDGEYKQAFPENDSTKKFYSAIRSQTKDSAPVFIHFVRVRKFVQQPQCGRVAFYFEQPSSNIVFKNLGGEINICADGTPPWRMCKADKRLISANAICPDNSPPVDTDEIAAAIEDAKKRGGLDIRELREKLRSDSVKQSSVGKK